MLFVCYAVICKCLLLDRNADHSDGEIHDHDDDVAEHDDEEDDDDDDEDDDDDDIEDDEVRMG